MCDLVYKITGHWLFVQQFVQVNNKENIQRFALVALCGGNIQRTNNADSSPISLQGRHNDHDSVSNYQHHGCLLNRLFRRRSKKTSKLRVTGLCVGNSPGPVNSPHKGPVTRKMFPFDDVIMHDVITGCWAALKRPVQYSIKSNILSWCPIRSLKLGHLTGQGCPRPGWDGGLTREKIAFIKSVKTWIILLYIWLHL